MQECRARIFYQLHRQPRAKLFHQAVHHLALRLIQGRCEGNDELNLFTELFPPRRPERKDAGRG